MPSFARCALRARSRSSRKTQMSTLPEVRFHIYPTDCDMLGHLNHATMLNFLERARWALLEPQLDVRQWAKQDVFSVVRHVDIGYLAQSFPGEDLVIRSGLLAIKRTSYIVRQAVIIGCSIGGHVAFAFWRRHRPRVRALVLSDTRASAETPEGAERRHALSELARTQGAGAVANVQIATLVGRTTRDKRPDIYDSVHRMIAQAPVDGIVGALEALLMRPESTATLPTIDVPTL